MKKVFLSLLSVAFLLACSGEKDASSSTLDRNLTKSDLDFETTKLELANDQHEFSYVKDQTYYGLDYCYAHLVASNPEFLEILTAFTNNYNTSKVWEIDLFGEGKKLCDGDQLTPDDVKYILIYYTDANNLAKLDYVRMSDGVKKTYPIANTNASTAIYLLRKSELSNGSISSIRNGDYNYNSINFDLNNDYVQCMAQPHYISPYPNGGSNDCPLNCPGETGDDCGNYGMQCTETFDDDGPICPVRHSVKQLNMNNNYQLLSSKLFSQFPIMYDFRDFLGEHAKGQDYILKYYALGRLAKSGQGNFSLSTMVSIANTSVNHISKLTKLINHSTNGNSILYTSADAAEFKTLLTTIKNESTNSTWKSIMDSVIADVETNKNKTVSNVVAFLKK